MLTFHVHVSAAQGYRLPAFDALLEAYRLLPRMFIEPDGSFVWRAEDDSGIWQVDGNLIDQGDSLAYVELKGSCLRERLEELLGPLGWPDAKLTFSLPRRGVSLSKSDFLSLAGSRDGAV